MTADSVRLGLVGCGRLAELGYVPAARAATGVELVAVADPAAARRELLADRLGVVSYPSASELLAGEALDGLVICCVPEQHEPAAAVAAAAGVAALVEKPPAPDAAGAQRLAALDPAPWVAFNRRFDQGLELADVIPPAGDLRVSLTLHYRRASWRPLARADDALLDLGPHLIDLALFLTTARPLAVRASAAANRAELVLRTSRGPVRVDCATDRPHRELVEVHDGGGRRVARSVRGGLARGVAQRMRPGAHPLVRSLTAQLESYGRALRGGPSGPLARAAEGATVMGVLDAARRSAEIGGAAVLVEPAAPVPPPPARRAVRTR